MNNKHSSGDTITVTAPSAVTSGAPFVLGALLCIPVTSAASGESVAVQIAGAFSIKKLGTAVIAAGAKLHWDVSAGEFIVAATAAGDLENCAVAIEAAGNGTAAVAARLCPGVGAVKAA